MAINDSSYFFSARPDSASMLIAWLKELGISSDDPLLLDDEERLATAAIEVARSLQLRAVELLTPQEKRQQAELKRMLDHPQDKTTLTQMTDQSFRSHSPDRVVDQIVHILDVQGVPRFFSSFDRTLLRGFQSFGGFLPGVAVPLVKEKMRKETANVILPAESEHLQQHLSVRRQEGLRMNVNFLGESLLGEREARRRLDRYLAALQSEAIECLSLKISTLYSQISPIARRSTVRTISDRLELIYRASTKESFQRHDGSLVPKFVYLDMEEYRDLRLTSEVFMETLSRPGLNDVWAGIALQAYIPDSYRVQQEITQWAHNRVATGGTPVTIRIVKGANMEMERVEASLRGWPQAPYCSKVETDANYKKMLQFGLLEPHSRAVRLGIASHNLFDVSYAIVLATLQNALERIQFEMLEGMANHQRRAVFERAPNMLLYAPACLREDFVNAIGYLIRRLDENTGSDNFLRHAFHLTPDSETWNRLADGFRKSIKTSESVSAEPQRKQNRFQPPLQPSPATNWQTFQNEPDTDFALPHHSEWANWIISEWQTKHDASATDVPLVVGSEEIPGEGALYESCDPSRPATVVCRYRLASARQIQAAVECASQDRGQWRTRSPIERYGVLRTVAQALRVTRGDLIGAALADGGKTILESDPEVSEAIDFVEFYALVAKELYQTPALSAKPKGTIAVISPWNFPIAIPCGGIAAALATGNTVILKPASDTVLPAYVLCQCFWRAGVPKEALQFLPCSGAIIEEHLLGREELSAVILTGGTETALRMLRRYPSLPLMAETGGKNATIVTSLSDRDLAIKNIIHSAFSHAGQKCSATSLVLLEDEVFYDASFRDQFVDAVTSISIGSAWDTKTKMGPLIRPPSGNLLQGLKELEHDEAWAVLAYPSNDNPCLYSPGVKWNVQPRSFTHVTELFGPVLGVMRFSKLTEAIKLVNATGFGLTSGLESLDDREQSIWRTKIRAGNLYINRSTTGAIVLRQPFGGIGKSCFGPGLKAGGPHYVLPLMDFVTTLDRDAPPSPELPRLPLLRSFICRMRLPKLWKSIQDVEGCDEGRMLRLIAAIIDYDQFAREEIRQEHDHFRLVGQENVRRYRALPYVRIRVVEQTSAYDVLAMAAAAAAVGSRVTLSREEGIHDATIAVLEELTEEWAGDIEFVEESSDRLIKSIHRNQIDRLRYGHPTFVPSEIRRAANESQLSIADQPVCPWGRVELPRYVEEQSISFDYHRYGNLSSYSTMQLP